MVDLGLSANTRGPVCVCHAGTAPILPSLLAPRGAEYQAEVGLLSRNILIAGEASMDSTKLGPHIRIEGGGSISGTQVRAP